MWQLVKLCKSFADFWDKKTWGWIPTCLASDAPKSSQEMMQRRIILKPINVKYSRKSNSMGASPWTELILIYATGHSNRKHKEEGFSIWCPNQIFHAVKMLVKHKYNTYATTHPLTFSLWFWLHVLWRRPRFGSRLPSLAWLRPCPSSPINIRIIKWSSWNFSFNVIL